MATIAEIVAPTDIKEWIGELRAMVSAIFHPASADDLEANISNPWKNTVYEGYLKLSGDENDMEPTNETYVRRLTSAVESLKIYATMGGNDWIHSQLDDFLNQSKGAFPFGQEPNEDYSTAFNIE